MRGAYISTPQGTAAGVMSRSGSLRAMFASTSGQTLAGISWRGSGFTYNSALGRFAERFSRFGSAAGSGAAGAGGSALPALTGGGSIASGVGSSGLLAGAGAHNLPILRPDVAVGPVGSGVRISGPIDRFELPRIREFIEDRARGGAPLASVDRTMIPRTPGVVTGGSSTQLGRNMMQEMGLARSRRWSGYQAQHIIPSELKDHPVLQTIGMDLDHPTNGMFLREPSPSSSVRSRHSGYHSVYNEVVRKQLDQIDLNQSIEDIVRQVDKLQQNLRGLQEKGLPLYPSQGASVELWEKYLRALE